MGIHAPKIGDIADLFVRELVTAVAPKHPHFVVRTMPRADRQVRDRLLAQGFSPISLKFFPGFLFVRFHPAQRLQIASLAGVHSIVGFAAQPSPVDEEELEALQRVIDAKLPVGPAPFPALGRPCRFTSGPLEGVRGIQMGPQQAPRVVLSLSLLQRSIAVEVEPEWVGPFLPTSLNNIPFNKIRK
jgi:transcription antitermination factor NusG